MHLVYIHQYFTTTKGSSGTRSYEASKAMIARGHQVTVICGRFENGATGLQVSFQSGRRQGVVEGINVVEFDLKYGNKASFLRRVKLFLKFAVSSLLELHRLPRADLIYATSTPITVAIPALWAKLCWRVPFIFEVRDLWPEIPIAMGLLRNRMLIWVSKTLVRAAYRYSECCITLSPGMTNGVLACEPRSRTIMIPNGSDLGLFETDSELAAQDSDVSRWLDSIGFSSDKLNFVYAGTIGYANHLDCLLGAIQLVAPRFKENLHFFVIGDGGLKADLEKRVLECCLSDYVSVIQPVPKTLLFKVLCVFDIGMVLLRDVADFREGTSPNKFFDYLAAGLPILCNFEGWLAKMLDQAGAGLSCTSGNHEKLAVVIEEFSKQSHEKRQSMRLASRILARQFDRAKIVSQQCDICEEVDLGFRERI